MSLNIPAADNNIVLTDITTANATTARHGLLKKLSNVSTEYLDGTGAFSTPAGGLAGSGSAFAIVGGSASGTTNGTNLLAAYVTAQAATPQGAALSRANRYTILLLPGVYDLGSSTLTLATQFIDIVGISPNTGRQLDAEDVSGYGDTLITSSGSTMKLTAAGTDVNVKNLAIVTTGATSSQLALDSSVSFLTPWRMENVYLNRTVAASGAPTMKIGVDYAGTWIDVRCFKVSSFGESTNFTGDTASGLFIRCKAGPESFGRFATGTFIDCECGGGLGGSTVSGTFIRCRGVSIAGGTGTIMDGTFTGLAEDCWSDSALSYTSGTIRNCTFAGIVQNRGLIFKKDTAHLGGTIKTDMTTTGNVGAGEDNLISYAVPAATLAATGDHLEFDVFGTFAANANTKRLKIFFGATAIFDSTALILNGVDWRGHGKIIRTGAATQKCTTEFTIGGTLLAALTTTITTYATAAETLANAITLKCTGEDSGGVPVNDSVVQQGLVLKWFPAGN